MLSFFRWLGPRRTAALRVCSDMWKPYLRVVAKKVGHALHVLDRFHIMVHMNNAIDKVRAQEARAPGIIDGGEEVQVAHVGGAHQLPQEGPAVDGLAQGRELERAGAIAVFHRAVVLKKRSASGLEWVISHNPNMWSSAVFRVPGPANRVLIGALRGGPGLCQCAEKEWTTQSIRSAARTTKR